MTMIAVVKARRKFRNILRSAMRHHSLFARALRFDTTLSEAQRSEIACEMQRWDQLERYMLGAWSRLPDDDDDDAFMAALRNSWWVLEYFCGDPKTTE